MKKELFNELLDSVKEAQEIQESITVKDKEIERNQFSGIKDKDLRCRNIAVMILNYYEDEGEETALMYTALNVTPEDEEHVKGWVLKLAEQRGWEINV